MALHIVQMIGLLSFCISCGAQCNNQTFLDFSGATQGNNPTTTEMNNSLFGMPGTWSITGPTEMVFTSTGNHDLPGYVNLCSGGFRKRSGTYGLQCTVPRTSQTIIFNPTTVVGNQASAYCWFYTDVYTNIANYFDFLTISDSTHGKFVNCSLYGNSNAWLNVRMELVGGNNNDSGAHLTTNSWYLVCAFYDNAPNTNYVAVFDVNLNQLGLVGVQSTYTVPPAACWCGVTASDYSGGTAHIFYDSALMQFVPNVPFPITPNQAQVVEYATNSIVSGTVMLTR